MWKWYLPFRRDGLTYAPIGVNAIAEQHSHVCSRQLFNSLVSPVSSSCNRGLMWLLHWYSPEFFPNGEERKHTYIKMSYIYILYIYIDGWMDGRTNRQIGKQVGKQRCRSLSDDIDNHILFLFYPNLFRLLYSILSFIPLYCIPFCSSRFYILLYFIAYSSIVYRFILFYCTPYCILFCSLS